MVLGGVRKLEAAFDEINAQMQKNKAIFPHSLDSLEDFYQVFVEDLEQAKSNQFGEIEEKVPKQDEKKLIRTKASTLNQFSALPKAVSDFKIQLATHPGFSASNESLVPFQDVFFNEWYKEARRLTDPLYLSVSTWPELIASNGLFLTGQLPISPTHVAPIDDETVPLMTKLIKIHQLGSFYTMEGQPGVCESRYLNDKILIKSRQKGYLIGFIPLNRAIYWMEELNQLRDFLNYVMVTPNGLVINTFSLTKRLSLTEEKKCDSQLDPDCALTPWQFYTGHEANDEQQWRNSRQDEIDVIEPNYPNIGTLLTENGVFLKIANQDWCKMNLEDLLLSFLDKEK